MSDLTVIYYTSNYLDEHNPKFVAKTREQLVKAVGDNHLISVSQKPMDFGENICVGDIGRSHLNIYRQILTGCKAAKTAYVAMAEDDILYSDSHFNFKRWIKPKDYEKDVFLYDMNKVSIFTWTKPPQFSFRSKRMVVNQLIAPRKMLIEALEERFKRFDELIAQGKTEEQIIKYWGDPGRYENLLGVTQRETFKFFSWIPSVVFTHEHAFGYLNHGSRKKLGDLRIIELADWGRAEDIVKMYYE